MRSEFQLPGRAEDHPHAAPADFLEQFKLAEPLLRHRLRLCYLMLAIVHDRRHIIGDGRWRAGISPAKSLARTWKVYLGFRFCHVISHVENQRYLLCALGAPVVEENLHHRGTES